MNALTDEEVIILKFARSLTEESSARFATLMYGYLFKIKNSERFHAQCKKQSEEGFNPFEIWMGKNNFISVYKKITLKGD